MCSVVPHVFIGSQDAAEHLPGLEAHEIDAILNLAFSNEAFPGRFVYRHLPLLDNETQPLDIEPALAFVAECVAEEKNVVIHCNAGVSRSAAVTIAYVMRSKNLSFEEALALVKKARPSIRPNRNFVEQLKKMPPI